MTTQNLEEIEGLINQELEEYSNLSNLYDEKKEILIKSDMRALINVDEKIKHHAIRIKDIEQKRKAIDEKLGLINASISDYIALAHKNAFSVEKNLVLQKYQLAKTSVEIANKEKVNIELLKHGLATVNKLISIIVNGASKTSQYNSYGKNTNDEYMKISSVEEEV